MACLTSQQPVHKDGHLAVRIEAASAEASSRSIDSLLNYETVKYFGNEEHEAQRLITRRDSMNRFLLRASAHLSC